MNTLRTLVLLVAGLSVVLSRGGRDLWQFRNQILCTLPDSSPIWDYTDYGCYCGYGGSGRPVDRLDRCCKEHDKCYGDAMQHDDCTSILDSPYIKSYKVSGCARGRNTCGNRPNGCARFICECDRVAAECFARSRYFRQHKRLPSYRCR